MRLVPITPHHDLEQNVVSYGFDTVVFYSRAYIFMLSINTREVSTIGCKSNKGRNGGRIEVTLVCPILASW